jgi:hypothetical protein
MQRRQLDEDAGHADKLLATLWNVLESASYHRMTIKAWQETITFKDALLTGTAGDVELPAGAELRQALNAAWLARVELARGAPPR